MTELIEAAKAGSVLDVQRILKENCVDVNYQHIEYAYTALYWAAANGHVDVCKYLLNKKANVNLQSKWGGSPLYVASYNGQSGTVHMLLSHGANVNLTDNQMRTPLHAAAYKGHLNICEKLLDGGANVTAVNADGKTPIVEAQGEGHRRVVMLLHRHEQSLKDGKSKKRPNTTDCFIPEKPNAAARVCKTKPLPLPSPLSTAPCTHMIVDKGQLSKHENLEKYDMQRPETRHPSDHYRTEQNSSHFPIGSHESHQNMTRHKGISPHSNGQALGQGSYNTHPSHMLKIGQSGTPADGDAVIETVSNMSNVSNNRLMEIIESLQLQVAMKNEEIDNLKFMQNQQEIMYTHKIEKLSKELEQEREKRQKVQGHLQFIGSQLRYKDGDHGLFDRK